MKWKEVFGLFCMGCLALGTAMAEAPSSTERPVVRACFIDKVNSPLVNNPGNPDAPRPGITIDFLKEVAKRNGVAFQFVSMPWARCLEKLKAGEFDAAFHASHTPGRSDYAAYPLKADGSIDPSRYLVKQSYFVYKRKSSPVHWNGEALTGLRQPIGTMISFSVSGKLKEMGYAVEESSSVEGNLKKLAKGRVDAFVNLSTQTDSVLGTDGALAKEIEKIARPFEVKFKYLIFSNAFHEGNRALVEAIWDSLGEGHRNGLFSQIEAGYGPD
jgi:polar amino acid transport system substrate-binding protein